MAADGDGEDARARQRLWYAQNADRIRERKRKRYEDDPIYRQKQQQWAREYRFRRIKAPLERVTPKPVGPQTKWKTVEVEINGVMTQVFTIGALAKVLGKGISTLRMWEKHGVLPATPYRNDKGDRLYPYELVTAIRKELVDNGRINPFFNQKKPPRLRVERLVRFSDGTERTLELFKVAVLAQAIRKKPLTIFHLETRGYVPKTPLLASSVRYRLYTAEMITAVKATLETAGYPTLGLQGARPDLIFNRIADEWRSLGVLDARVVEDKDASQTCDGRKRERAPVGDGEKPGRGKLASDPEPSIDDASRAEAL